MSFFAKMATKMSERYTQRTDVLGTLEKAGLKLDETKRNERFDICLSCPELYQPTKACKVCGCFMQIKTYMPNQSCPLGKWQKYTEVVDEKK